MYSIEDFIHLAIAFAYKEERKILLFWPCDNQQQNGKYFYVRQ